MIRKDIIVERIAVDVQQAARITGCANRFNSDISFLLGDVSVDAKSLMGVLALTLRRGTEFTLAADGSDEAEAISAISAYFA